MSQAASTAQHDSTSNDHSKLSTTPESGIRQACRGIQLYQMCNQSKAAMDRHCEPRSCSGFGLPMHARLLHLFVTEEGLVICDRGGWNQRVHYSIEECQPAIMHLQRHSRPCAEHMLALMETLHTGWPSLATQDHHRFSTAFPLHSMLLKSMSFNACSSAQAVSAINPSHRAA